MRTILVYLLLCGAAFGVEYPIVAVRSVRPDDTTLVRFPEVFNAVVHPPSDLVILQPDGTLEVLVSGNGTDALFDPRPSLDGEWLYYVRIPDSANFNPQRGSSPGAPRNGADIWRVNLENRQQVRITDQRWSLPGSAGNWSDTPSLIDPSPSSTLSIGYGVVNIGPCPLPGGRLAFTSTRRGYQPPHGFSFPNTQLFIIDDIPGETDTNGEAGRNVECTGFLNVSAALHPVLMMDGRILWSSQESQGRDRRLWSIWHSYPDGREWGPVYSVLSGEEAYHFHGQRSDGSIFSTVYYNLNNNGAGAIWESPLSPGTPEYLDPNSNNNPKIPIGWLGREPWFTRLSTQRRGLYSVTPWTTGRDHANGIATDDGFVPKPKVTHPSGAPDNGLLVAITPGPANNLMRPVNRPVYHFKVGLISGRVAETEGDVEIILQDASHNFTQPVAMVQWADIYGTPPTELPVLPNASGTPFGVIGSSSAHIGQWKPVDVGSLFTVGGKQGFWTGAPGNESDTPPAGIDVVGLSPSVAQAYWTKSNDSGWSNAINERARILTRVLLNEPDRPANDSSWAAQVPADVPFTFRTFDASGRTITWARTWHQVRPGETRVNCGGCHNHSGPEVKWESSWFSTKVPRSFDESAVRTPEFNRDVLPILQEKCHGCHNAVHPVQLDSSLAKSVYVVPGKAFSSRLSKAIHGEGETAQMPLDAEPLTAAERLKIDEWIDYWCLVAEPGKADFDESPPTLYVSRSGTLKVGAYDYQSGLESVTVDGEPVELTDHVWTGPQMQPGETYTVVATDLAGSRTTIERHVREDAPPPPGDELERLRQEIAELRRTVEELMAKIAAAKAALE